MSRLASLAKSYSSVIEVPKGRRHPHPVFAGLPDIERFAKSEKDRKLLGMHRAFVGAGTPFMLPPGTPADKVQILREAMRRTFDDPEFYAEFKKLVGEEPTPLMPQELEKAVRELPRDRETVELFNKLSGAELLALLSVSRAVARTSASSRSVVTRERSAARRA